MITELTPSQIAKIPEYVDKWVSIGLCTDPIDMNRVKEAVNQCYECAGLEPPTFILKFDSPLQAMYAVNTLNQSHAKIKIKDQVGNQVGIQVWNRASSQVSNQISNQISDQVWDQVIDQVWHQVSNQVRDQVSDQARDQVWNQVRNQVWNQVRHQVSDQVSDPISDPISDQVRDQIMLYGCHEAYWLAFYDFFQEVCDINLPKIKGLTALAKECGWWSPYKGIAIVQERPALIKFDQEQRLHCETGPAIQYRDGFSVYAWHGTRVPEAWIMNKDSLNPHDILKHENIEQRRAGCEILGWDRIIVVLKPVIIDEDTSQVGTLLEVNLPGSGSERFLKVQCGTGRTFVIPVPPGSPSALWANAWTYNMQDQDLQRFRDVFRT